MLKNLPAVQKYSALSPGRAQTKATGNRSSSGADPARLQVRTSACPQASDALFNSRLHTVSPQRQRSTRYCLPAKLAQRQPY